eukprot:10436951-Heterocapsa_arctica.AAC.1
MRKASVRGDGRVSKSRFTIKLETPREEAKSFLPMRRNGSPTATKRRESGSGNPKLRHRLSRTRRKGRNGQA